MFWWSQALLASIITSLVSVGAFGVLLIYKKSKKITLLLVSLAAGSLLGDAFIHLIPQSVNYQNWGIWVMTGIGIFFILEKVIHWRHCHQVDCHEGEKIAKMSITADSFHNFIDGIAIGSAFGMGTGVGVATTMAILIHEIPQEMGDMAILRHSGISPKRALFINFISGCFSILGVIVTIFLGGDKIYSTLGLIAAGGFIYLAASDLIPEIHRHDSKLQDSLISLLMFSLGIALMWWFKVLE